jgi:hypothetical protein
MAAGAGYLAVVFLFSALLAWIAIPRHLGETHATAKVEVRKVSASAAVPALSRSQSGVQG